MIDSIQVILYVADQSASRDFYQALLRAEPVLDVPGMTEFNLGTFKLGLMPEAGIKRLLPGLAEPAGPRCELYLLVDDPERWHARALTLGARELAVVASRDWGHRAGYVADPDGHVLAFARAD